MLTFEWKGRILLPGRLELRDVLTGLVMAFLKVSVLFARGLENL